MKILVTGNLGYVGPVIGKVFKRNLPESILHGLDLGLFSQCITPCKRLGDTFYDQQIFRDCRDVTADLLKGVEVVICLAAVSNDPIGKDFESATKQINMDSSLKLARLADENGVKRFIFASSCSMYGTASNNAKKETDTTNPLTAYARSKVGVEKALLDSYQNSNMEIICLRFSTACGVSDRLRLDLVLNDFVTSAVKYKEITVLSDGSPWRPLIDVEDMAYSFLWASTTKQTFEKPTSINIGSNEWNFQVKDLAEKVGSLVEGTNININKSSPPDKRSYKVDFSLYKKLAPNYYPRRTIESTISNLIQQVSQMELPEDSFRSTNYIRLNHIRTLLNNGLIDKNLCWI